LRPLSILAKGEPTKFAFEGACRHGLRSRLCLEGQPWATADKFAGEVVSEALRRLGAERPMWIEGQPEAAQVVGERRFTCAYQPCGRPIPEYRGHHIGGQGVKFCSDECAHAAHDYRNRLTVENANSALAAAWRAARSGESELTKTCVGCGETFAVKKWRDVHRQYCTHACFTRHKMKWAPRPCAACGKTFKPLKRDSKYCSNACKGIGKVKPKGERQCKGCGTGFTPRFPGSPMKFCSRKCSADHANAVRWGDGHKPQERRCVHCGSSFVVESVTKVKKFCSHRCYVESRRAPAGAGGIGS
jgi:hypothetical protein